ncbi:hypothetical protein [Soonwooa sp.]|uniref:hypothetical protein n=1 Tax=Soonwooa sp. TaxID=1938592 RepID=UPI0028979A73|nr:hypothetical protein [Soonwooa sp.]
MGLTNLNNTHLTAAKITDAQDALTALETALQDIQVNLSAEDRKKYGSINEQNKLFVNKVADFNKNTPQLSATDVDWAEFDKDYNSRLVYEGLIARLLAVATNLQNAKILHDYDNYQAALTDYAYSNYKQGTNTPGYEVKVNELKQFFTRTPQETPPTT